MNLSSRFTVKAGHCSWVPKKAVMRTKPIYRFYLYVLICVLGCSGYISAGQINQLSREEKQQGFKLLFDGKSMNQWRNYKSKTTKPQWQVIDETMVLTAKGGRDLVTKESFDYFDLRLEYRITEKGNSGVMFRVVENTDERNAWRLAPEFQLYDSFNVKVRGDRCAGALYGLIAAPKDLARKPGEWNQVRILLEPLGGEKDRLRFWLNGQRTVDVIIDFAPDSEWFKLLASKKSEDHFAEGFFRANTGPILLQDHGARVAFRSIRIRKLNDSIPRTSPKPRIIATTDGEVDDRCSMVRFLMYANEWDIKGIIYSSSKHHWKGDGKKPGRTWHGETWIQEQIDAYAKVWGNLRRHDPGYPSPDYLKKQVFVGNIELTGDMKKPTPGSNRIVEVLLDPDLSPVWLQAWGGANTIARALKTIEERHPNRIAEVSRKVRLFLISLQDQTFQNYISRKWPNVQTLVSRSFGAIAYRWQEILPSEQHKYFNLNWMNTSILKNHCPLCAIYPAHSKRGFISEGDSPSFMHLIDVGLRGTENPTYGGWGGRFTLDKKHVWVDAKDDGDKYKTIYRWAIHFQNDWAARADWCVKSYEEANHPPIVKLSHRLDLEAKKGQTIQLSAKGTKDPDGDKLVYKWWQYKEPGSFTGLVKIVSADKQQASFIVPDNTKKGQTVHLICEVTDDGAPALTRYQRVIVEFASK